MFVKKILGGVAIVGALALLPAAASAHDYYHHHWYRPVYYPPVVVAPAPVVVAPAPVVIAPIQIPIDVFYRVTPTQTWTFYGTYSTRFDADRAAHNLENTGYSVMIQNR